MALWIEHTGNTAYTTTEIERGVAAAKAALAANRVDAQTAYNASLADADGQPADPALVSAWRDAEIDALNAAEQGWASTGSGSLVWQ